MQPNLDPYQDLIMDPNLAQNKYPEALEKLRQSGKQLPLMASVVTREFFEKNKNKKSKTAGWTLARAINTGVLYPSSFVGCHAGDYESYFEFKELFFPVIEGYHKGFKINQHKHVTDFDSSKITESISETAKSKIISTRIRVARNLNMFPLNPGGSKETRLQIADLMEKVFTTLPDDLKGQFIRHIDMTPEQTQQLIDDHFLFKGRDKMQAASGYHQFWPYGRGIFQSQNKFFNLWINEGDHLRIISMEQGGEIKRVFERLGKGVKAIEIGLKNITGLGKVFMSDPILGMITCCPSNLGTCMRGSVHILLPKLIKRIGFEEINNIAQTMNCQARGSSGEHTEVIDRIDISNWRRLGFTEAALVNDMIKCANHLAKMEDEIPNNYHYLQPKV